MGTLATRLLAAFTLLFSLPLLGQETTPTARFKINYKRFTRGKNAKVQDEAAGRLEWFRERMGGALGPDFADRLLSQAELERAKYPSQFPVAGGPLRPLAASGTTWVSLGPTSSNFTQNGVQLAKVDSGRLRVILPDPSDGTGNTVLLLAAGGGLWKTTDFLNANPVWTALTDFVGSNMSGSAAFGRTSSTLYVGAGDPFDAGVGGFMIKSVNGGTTWTNHVALGAATLVTEVKVDISQGGGQTSDIVLVGTDVGLYRSIDGGTSYSAVTSAPGLVWSIVNTSAGWLLSTVANNGAGTLLLSTNHGATWSAISNSGSVYSGAGRTTLAVGAPGDAIVYAFAATAGTGPFQESDQKDLYRSIDGGQTWTAKGLNAKVAINAAGNADQPNMDLMHGQAWYNQMILVDPSDASKNTLYLGGDLSSARSTDGGTTWTLISNWLPDPTSGTGSLPYIHADFHCAAYSNFGGSARLYFGGDGGIFTSTNAGASWDDTKNKGLVNHLLYTLVSNPATSGSVLTGMQDLGIRLREGTTPVFNQVQGGDGFGIGWSQTGNAMSLGSYVYNAIVACTANPPDDQAKFNDFTSGLGHTGGGTGSTVDNGASYYFVTPVNAPPGSADPSGQVFFTYGNSNNGLSGSPSAGPNSGKIFRSSGTGWTTIATPGSSGMTANRFVRAVSHGIGVSPVDLQHIAAAENGGNVLYTTNGGSSWTEVYLGSSGTDGVVPGWLGFNANVAWANNNLLYICSEVVTAGAIRLAKSSNGGATWIRADGGLPDVPITKLAVDPGDATGNTVYAATWIGVYRTTNGGTAWSPWGTGLPQGRVTDIWVAPNSATIRVATWGRGVWELASPVSGPTVILAPTTAVLVYNGTQAFTPTVAGGTTNTVTWSATSGAIAAGPTGSGVAHTYTAPAAGTTDTVTATTVDTPQAQASAAITLVAPAAVTVAVSPASVDLMTTTGSQQFLASVSAGGAPLTNSAVTWSVTGGVGLSGTGLFSAGSLAAGPYTITATSAAASSQTGTATVTLLAPASVTVTVSPLAVTLGTNGSHQFTATVTGPSLSANKAVAWSTSGGGTITSAGLFTASTAVGSPFTITATNTFSGAVGTATVNVVTLDLNGDGTVSPLDLLTFAKYYGTTNASCLLSGDSTVSDADLAILLAGM